MPVESGIPIIPSANLEKSLRLWVDDLGFWMSSEMHKDDKLIFCMLRKDSLWFMLNQRAGTPVKPEDYEGIRLRYFILHRAMPCKTNQFRFQLMCHLPGPEL